MDTYSAALNRAGIRFDDVRRPTVREIMPHEITAWLADFRPFVAPQEPNYRLTDYLEFGTGVLAAASLAMIVVAAVRAFWL